MYDLVEGEYRFFEDGEVPFYSTQEFHDDREAAPHIDQHGMQRDRLVLAAEFVKEFVLNNNVKTVTDICCGDGGLLEYLKPFFEEHNVKAWGYDFQPANVRDAQYKRKVDVTFADVVNDDIELGELSIMTECLEHFYRPHEMVRKVAEQSKYFVASGPNGETPEAHYGLHLWGWSEPAYRNLLEQAGYKITRHENISIFQVVAGVHA
jgi:2-polyprenyl-3-methyl-5-hydroxy-6-metoxy-1,4-benzoquinol methylase